MKKLILSIAFMGFGVALISAQTPAASKAEVKQTPKAEQKVMAPKAEQKVAAPKMQEKKTEAPAAKTDANGAVLKKDGTPDKRYKLNKEAKGPMKKDGTPDKRFKANKDVKPAEKK